MGLGEVVAALSPNLVGALSPRGGAELKDGKAWEGSECQMLANILSDSTVIWLLASVLRMSLRG